MSVQLSFHGGVETVSGSCHLLQVGSANVLVDCGLFQGGRAVEKQNYEPFGFDPSSIDYLLLTHGHLDHCGRIPVLVKKGFKGKIICTAATYDIAKIILMDSAKIQEEDFEHWKRIKQRRGQVQEEPLYTTAEVLDALRYFNTFVRYQEIIKLNSTVTASFRDSGHIFGSSFIEITVKGFGTIVFSGDLGNKDKPVIKNPSITKKADVLIVEGTYGNRRHKSINESVEEMKTAILNTFSRGGNVLIPSFAVERAQDLLYFLREFHDQGELPSCRTFLDSPMAIRVTDVMRKHPYLFDQETERIFNSKGDPFHFPGLEFTKTPEESRQINFLKSHSIIIAGSGMCTGGRIKHHLKHNIWRKESTIIFVGYQASGTLGRDIVEKKRKVRIFGEPYRVRAKVSTIGGFSSHADKDILIEWLSHNKNLSHVFLVHGEDDGLTALKKEIRSRKKAKHIYIPRMHQKFSL
jgi:metallo-beta-lactamase family protein